MARPLAAAEPRICWAPALARRLPSRMLMSSGFLQDIRTGTRLLARNPAFTLIAVLSLGVGIGANTATFSFADGLLLRPLPVPNPSEVVSVGAINVASGDTDFVRV